MIGPESPKFEELPPEEAASSVEPPPTLSEIFATPERGVQLETSLEQGPSEIDWPRRIRLTDVVEDTGDLTWLKEGSARRALQEAKGGEAEGTIEEKVACEIEKAFERLERVEGEEEQKTRFERIEEGLSRLGGVKVFGKDMKSFLAGMAAGGALRFATKMALGGGTGIGLSAIAGGVSGGVMAGWRAYNAEVKRLREEERKPIEDRFLALYQERAAIKGENLPLREKLGRYLELAQSATNDDFLQLDVRPEFENLGAERVDERQALFRELQVELKIGAIKAGQVVRGALRGAAIGAVGGALGHTVAGLFESYMLGGSGAAETAAKKVSEVAEERGEEFIPPPEEVSVPPAAHIPESSVAPESVEPPTTPSAGAAETENAPKASAEAPVEDAASTSAEVASKAAEAAAPEHVKMAAGEAYQKAYQKGIEEGLQGLKEKSFYAAVEKGDGATHIARKFIHDFLSVEHTLGKGDVALSKGELIYAEDWFRRRLEKGSFTAGEMLALKGEDIAAAIEEAKTLEDEAEKQILEKWGSKISEETWKETLDYGKPFSPDNTFAEDITKSAKEAAERAAGEAGKELARETPGSAAAEATLSKTAETVSEEGAESAANAVKKSAGKVIETIPAEEAREVIKEAVGEWTGARVIEMGSYGKEALISAALFSVGAGGYKGMERFKKWREGRKENFEADPIRNFFEGLGIPLQKIRYECPAEEGKIKTFKNYADFRRYWEGLGSEGRRVVRGSGFRYGLVWGSEVSKARSMLPPEREKEFLELRKKIDDGVAADGNVFPEERKIPSGAKRRGLAGEINRMTGIKFSGIESDIFSGEEEYEGLKTLQEAIRYVDPVDIEVLKDKEVAFAAGTERKIEKLPDSAHPLLFLNPHMTREEMTKFLAEAVRNTIVTGITPKKIERKNKWADKWKKKK